MHCRIGDVVWLRRDSRLVDLRGRVGTNLGRVGDAWADDEGEHISVVYEDEQVLAVDLAPSEFVVERLAGARAAEAQSGKARNCTSARWQGRPVSSLTSQA